MIPNQVNNAVYDHIRPLVKELARYAAPGETVEMKFEEGTVVISF